MVDQMSISSVPFLTMSAVVLSLTCYGVNTEHSKKLLAVMRTFYCKLIVHMTERQHSAWLRVCKTQADGTFDAQPGFVCA